MIINGFYFPDEAYLDLQRDLWLRPLENGTIRIGVNSFGVHLSGHFFMCRPKPIGTELQVDQSMAIVELNKTIISIKTPISGVVVALNPTLADTPELIEKDCYETGWLIDIKPSSWAEEAKKLVLVAASARAIAERIALEPETILEPALPPASL